MSDPVSPLLLSLVVVAIVIILAELLLWALFMRKTAGIVFPRASDFSSMRISAIETLRVGIIIHAMILFAITAFSFLYLW